MAAFLSCKKKSSCFALSDAINMQIQQECGMKLATLISLLLHGCLETVVV
jgi:hypothetical protein